MLKNNAIFKIAITQIDVVLSSGFGMSEAGILVDNDARAATLRKDMGWMDENDVSVLLQVSTKTLASWRMQNIGPCYTKLGHQVFYRLQKLQEWFDLNEVVTTQQVATREAELVA